MGIYFLQGNLKETSVKYKTERSASNVESYTRNERLKTQLADTKQLAGARNEHGLNVEKGHSNAHGQTQYTNLFSATGTKHTTENLRQFIDHNKLQNGLTVSSKQIKQMHQIGSSGNKIMNNPSTWKPHSTSEKGSKKANNLENTLENTKLDETHKGSKSNSSETVTTHTEEKYKVEKNIADISPKNISATSIFSTTLKHINYSSNGNAFSTSQEIPSDDLSSTSQDTLVASQERNNMSNPQNAFSTHQEIASDKLSSTSNGASSKAINNISKATQLEKASIQLQKPTIHSDKSTIKPNKTLNSIDHLQHQMVLVGNREIEENFLMHMAYYDPRTTKPSVVMFGSQLHYGKEPLCLFKTQQGMMDTICYRNLISRSDTWDSHYDVFNTYAYYCTIPDGVELPPREVYVKTQNGTKITTLTVFDASEEKPVDSPMDLAVCVKTARNNLDPVRLAEWFEFNKLVGVKNFILYDANVTGDAVKVMRHFQEQGILTVVKDTIFHTVLAKSKEILPFLNQNEHKSFCQLLQAELFSIQDCLYRFKHKYNFILLIDIDEVLVPTKNETIQHVIKNLLATDPQTKALIFPAGHHFREYGVHSVPEAPPYLYTVNHLKRTPVVWFQSKSVLIPSRIFVANWHMPRWPFLAEYDSHTTATESDAYVHHFRNKCKYNNEADTRNCKEILEVPEIDDVLPRYLKMLQENTFRTLKLLNLS